MASPSYTGPAARKGFSAIMGPSSGGPAFFRRPLCPDMSQHRKRLNAFAPLCDRKGN